MNFDLTRCNFLHDCIKLASIRKYGFKEQHRLFIYLKCNLECMRCLSFDKGSPFLIFQALLLSICRVAGFVLQNTNRKFGREVCNRNIIQHPPVPPMSISMSLILNLSNYECVVVLMVNKSLCHY